ncbi:DNA cytosine methyltransferase [Gemmatimonas sp.]|uniref:DNA cytosine methyltransferase n=1 Tax=Gemmatimonas sp. TaxID=1962908 RepID=UPI00333F3B7C
MNELALFAGAGGGILGGHLLGWRTVCAVEWEPYPTSVLIARQNEGVLPPFPIWDDVRTFDGRPWRGRVDVVSGGFPCQDISAAGKGAGIDGERSGMWAHMARIIREVGPRYAFVENSPMLTSRGLGRVLGDLAAMGYDARWGVLGAVDAGAPHRRDRIWIVADATGVDGHQRRPKPAGQLRKTGLTNGGDDVANPNRLRELQPQGHECDERRWSGDCGEDVADAMCDGPQGQRQGGHAERPLGLCNGEGSDQIEHLRDTAGEGLPLGVNGPLGQPRALSESERSSWWATEPDVGRVAHGVAARVDRLKAIGNGQVPAVAALAWRILSK